MSHDNTHKHYTSQYLLLLLIAASLLGGLLLAPMDAAGQLVSSVVVLVIISLCSREAGYPQRYQYFFRTLALVLGAALTFRYLLWRGLYTLTAADVFSLIAVWILFLAEIYAGITSV